jgi:hypothetical protein
MSSISQNFAELTWRSAFHSGIYYRYVGINKCHHEFMLSHVRFLGVKQTLAGETEMSGFEPKRTWTLRCSVCDRGLMALAVAVVAVVVAAAGA